jgi:hypothetical protein
LRAILRVLAVAGATTALVHDWSMPATAQAKLYDPGSVLLVPTPGGDVAVFPQSPGAIFRDGLPGAWSGGSLVQPDIRSLPDPVVGDNSIGFYNSSDSTLHFTVEVATKETAFDLVPHEVKTIDLPEGSTAKGTIPTLDTSEELALSTGVIYVLKSQGGRWVFSAL